MTEQDGNRLKLTVLVPVYNEEAVIAASHERVTGVLDELLKAKAIDDCELLYVDDGSRDNSMAILRRLSAGSAKVKVISFSRNFGHQPALVAGLLHATGDVVISLDADLQDPPELFGEMLGKFREGNDIVYAVRGRRRNDTFFKRWTARMFYRLMRAMGVDIVYDHADYRLVSRRVVEEFRKMQEVNIFLRGMFPFMGFPHALVRYDRQERLAGDTKYPLRKMLAFAWEGITSFSGVPLRLASFMGFIFSLASLLLVVWALSAKFGDKAIPGWTSIVIPVLGIGGVNLLFLGVIGEYVSKIYAEVKRRPLFIIKEKYNLD